MNLKTIALLGLPVLLLGCPGEDSDIPDDTSVTPVDTDTDPPTDTDTEPPPPLQVTVVRSEAADALTLTITNGSENYSFGFAETAVEAAGGSGWFGEDCYNGQAGFAFCHPAGQTGVTLAGVDDTNAIVEGSTTLLAMDQAADRLTFILIGDTSGACWVFGDDPSYYAGFTPACTTMDAANVTLQ